MKVLDLDVQVVKKDIKNMHLSVYPPTGRVRVAAPKHTDNEVIRLFVIDKLTWIKRNQKEFKNQKREAPKNYVSGESHYLDGKRYRLKLIEGPGKHRIRIPNKSFIELYVQPNTSITNKKKVFDQFYREYLQKVLDELIKKWEDRLNEKCNSWKIRSMKTKWGSCQPENRRLLFNLELAKKPKHCVEYIVLHEMLHFKERHHNERFKSLLDQHMPNWKGLKRELEELPLVSWEG